MDELNQMSSEDLTKYTEDNIRIIQEYFEFEMKVFFQIKVAFGNN